MTPIYLLALLLISLFAWTPLLYPGYFQLHSGYDPLFNLADLSASQSFLRWLPPTAGTSPLYGDGALAYWLAWLVQPALGGVGALKAVLALSIALGGLGMFWWTRRIAASDSIPGKETAARAGLLAGVVYMLWPPLLVNSYVAGGFGTALFMGLLPWALGAISYARSGRGSDETRGARLVGLLLTALAAAGLALANRGLGLAAMPLLTAWALWPPAPWTERLGAAAAVLAGVVLVWLPGAAAGLPVAAQGIEQFLAHSVHPYQLLSPVWGFGVSSAGWRDDLSFQIGFVAFGLSVLTVAFAASNRPASPALPDERAGRSRPGSWYAIVFAALAAFLLILLTTTLARPLWRLAPALTGLFGMPADVLALAGPLLALLAGLLVHVERRMAALPVWAALTALVALGSYPYLAPRATLVEPDLAVAAAFGGGEATLLRADLSSRAANPSPPGDEGSSGHPPRQAAGQGEALAATNLLTATLSWQATQPPDFDYNVFVHAFDGQGNRIAQWDGQPQRAGADHPMTSWNPGEVVTGDYVLALAEGRAASDVRSLWLGLYNWQTGERLPVLAGGDDKVVVDLAAEAGRP